MANFTKYFPEYNAENVIEFFKRKKKKKQSPNKSIQGSELVWHYSEASPFLQFQLDKENSISKLNRSGSSSITKKEASFHRNEY